MEGLSSCDLFKFLHQMRLEGIEFMCLCSLVSYPLTLAALVGSPRYLTKTTTQLSRNSCALLQY